VDPYAVLGIDPGATPEEITAAFRRLAKRWHPDMGGGDAAVLRMAQVNAAYDLLRAAQRRGQEPIPAAGAAGPRPAAGAWLPDPVRRALGPELVSALDIRETVALVTPASTWSSPQALLAVTDRRLLWLLDDAPTHRVRFLRFRDVERVESRLRRPFRRRAALRVRTTAGRRVVFADLRPTTAMAIAGQVRAALPAR
jgi:curved DNA-binding protein CbpA